ncbi:MAG TPA: aminotransferase class III-fold pyridoxal phosphate-dependent enzyme, partial [Pseudomonadales bacterium]|nr:aminotransferase class III-fold pyridoxal phosphate-dependent enzyme [Pseudomonadales bacterium]
QVQDCGEYLRQQLTQLSKIYGLGIVRGGGLLNALEIPQGIANRVVDNAFEYGLLLNAPRPNILRFMPALNVSRDEIDQMIMILGKILEQTLE